MSSWKTRFHPEALKEVERMDGQIKSLAKSKLKQISANPFVGIALGNKHGIDLTGYYILQSLFLQEEVQNCVFH